MKKALIILLMLISINIASAGEEILSTMIHVESNNGTVSLWMDGGNRINNIHCDTIGEQIAYNLSVSKNINCEQREQGTIDTLTGDMSKFIHYYNDTRIVLFQDYKAAMQQLKDCQVSNEHHVELYEDCNGTTSDWYKLYTETQTTLNQCQSKQCYDQNYVNQMKEDQKDSQYKTIGATALIIGAIAYALYFKKGLAQNPYNKI